MDELVATDELHALEVVWLAIEPTADPTQAFQFVTPFVQVVEMACPVCCTTVFPFLTTFIDTAPVLPWNGTLP